MFKIILFMSNNDKQFHGFENLLLRKVPSPGNNYNMYAGSSEYKMNKYLQFQTIHTEERFINHIMNRFKMLRNALSYISFFLFPLIVFISWKKIFCIVFFVLAMIAIIFSNRMKFSRNITRLIFAIEEFLFFLVLKDEENFIHSYSINLIIDYIYNISICFPWYFNFVINSLIISLYFYNHKTFSFIFDLVVYLIAIISYGFFERLIKESWVLFDSFKRSEHNYRIILDNTDVPLMIVNSHLKFEYINKAGIKTIFQDFKQQFNYKNNRKMIHYSSPLHKSKLYKSFMVCLKNNESLKVNILFNFSDLSKPEVVGSVKEENSFYSSQSEVSDTDIDNEILFNHYKFFKCDLTKAAWKQQSNMILVRIKNQTEKYLKKQINNRKKEYFLYSKEQENEYLKMSEIRKIDMSEIDPLYKSFFYFSHQEEMKAFNISELLYVILNSCYYSSKWKNITINYKRNCNCPNEGIGKYKCLAFVLSSLLKYFALYSSDTTLNFDYSFIDIQNEKYELKLILNCDEFPLDKNKHLHQILNIQIQDLAETFKLMNDFETINLILCKKYAQKFLNGNLSHIMKQTDTSFEIILNIRLNRMTDSSQIEHFTKIKNMKNVQELNNIWDKTHESIPEDQLKNKRLNLPRMLNHSQTIEKNPNSDLRGKLKAICNRDLYDKNTKKNEENEQLKKIHSKTNKSKDSNGTNEHKSKSSSKELENCKEEEDEEEQKKQKEHKEQKDDNLEYNNNLLNENRNLSIKKGDDILYTNEENKKANFNKLSLSELLKGTNSEINHSEIPNTSKIEEKSEINESINRIYSSSSKVIEQEDNNNKNSNKIEKSAEFKEISMNELNSFLRPPSNNENINQDAECIEEYNQKEFNSMLLSKHFETERVHLRHLSASKEINFGFGKKSKNSPFEEAKIQSYSERYLLLGKIRIQQSLEFAYLQQKLKSFTLVRKLCLKPKRSNKNVRQLNNPKVLVVEDNDFQLSTITNILKNNNIDYEVAKNGIAALNTFESNMRENLFYTLIFMDLVMPVMNGYEATRCIRAAEEISKCRRTFICGLSSDISEDIKRKCNEAGMDNFMKKPTNAVELTEIVSNVFKKLHAEIQSNSSSENS